MEKILEKIKEFMMYLQKYKDANIENELYDYIRFLTGRVSGPTLIPDEIMDNEAYNSRKFYKDFVAKRDGTDFIADTSNKNALKDEWYSDRIAAHWAGGNLSYVKNCLLEIMILSDNGISEESLNEIADMLDSNRFVINSGEENDKLNKIKFFMLTLNVKEKIIFLRNVIKNPHNLALLLGYDYITTSVKKDKDSETIEKLLVVRPDSTAVRASAINQFNLPKIYGYKEVDETQSVKFGD